MTAEPTTARDGLTPGARVAQVAHELLDPGPIGHKVRQDAYRSFIAENFEDSPSRPVYTSSGTNCAIFVRGCLNQAGILQSGPRPRITGITSWLGVTWFGSDWVSVKDLVDGDPLLPGDILYWCGGTTPAWNLAWKAATNGHVGLVLFDGDGWMQQTAEGGGADHLCRMSDGAKDIRISHGRPLRGVWRPRLIWRRRLRKSGFLVD